MLSNQGWCCAICQTTKPGNEKYKHFSVDHNHETGDVRGLLCGACNFAIGMMKVDKVGSSFLRKATEYIEKSEDERKYYSLRLA